MESCTLGIREDYRFRGRSPTARTLACLRFVCLVSKTDARLATGSGGLTLSRTGFAPAGRPTQFHEGIAPPLPFDQHCLAALHFLSACPPSGKELLGLPVACTSESCRLALSGTST